MTRRLTLSVFTLDARETLNNRLRECPGLLHPRAGSRRSNPAKGATAKGLFQVRSVGACVLAVAAAENSVTRLRCAGGALQAQKTHAAGCRGLLRDWGAGFMAAVWPDAGARSHTQGLGTGAADLTPLILSLPFKL